MSTDLTLDLVQSQITQRQRLLVDENTVREINKLAKDPDYGEEFITSYVDHLNVLKDNPKRNQEQYLQAMKFFSLVEAGNSLTDAYIKTFPERYEARQKNHPDLPTGDKSYMRGEASRFNSTKLLADIRHVATIPVQLIYRHVLHDAIMVNVEMMTDQTVSAMVRQKAADTLIRELKPQEDAVLKIQVDDNATSVIEELANATKELAAQQRKSVLAGVPLREISAAKLIHDDDIEDGEFSEQSDTA